jgi:phospholipase/carboxylesterase
MLREESRRMSGPIVREYTVEPGSGQKPEFVVIFFHGYGSSASLMAGYVGGLLGPMLPEAQLRFPDAPIELGWDNHSWFDVEDMLKAPDQDKAAPRARAGVAQVNAYIDRVIEKEGISPDRVIIAGFSQGATTAYYAAMLRDEAVGGLYALSGGALEKLGEPRAKMPVALLAGEQEAQGYSGVPQQLRTAALLEKKDFAVETMILPDQEHDISKAALKYLRDFARRVTAPAAGPTAGLAPAADRPFRASPPEPPRL